MSTKWMLLIGALCGAACTQAINTALDQRDLTYRVQQHVANFNQQDVDAMVSNMSDAFSWYQINEGEISLEANSKDQLREGMTGYFESVPTVSSSIGAALTNGSFVAAVETVAWDAKDGSRKSQASLSVYEFDDDLIKNVWYFPAVTINE